MNTEVTANIEGGDIDSLRNEDTGLKNIEISYRFPVGQFLTLPGNVCNYFKGKPYTILNIP